MDVQEQEVRSSDLPLAWQTYGPYWLSSSIEDDRMRMRQRKGDHFSSTFIFLDLNYPNSPKKKFLGTKTREYEWKRSLLKYVSMRFSPDRCLIFPDYCANHYFSPDTRHTPP